MNIFSSDLDRSTEMISEVEGYAYTPQGLVHALIPVEPAMAASLVTHMDDQGRRDVAIETLIVFAFDAARSRTNPSLGLSLEKDRRFLEHLVETRGREWLTRYVAMAIAKYQRDVVSGRIDARFIEEYAATLRAIIRTQQDPDRRVVLERVMAQAFDNAGVGPVFRGQSPAP